MERIAISTRVQRARGGKKGKPRAMTTEGMAFLDGSGRVVAADPGFRAAVGSLGGDATEALRRRAVEVPALAALLAGEGPDVVQIPAGGGVPACEFVRFRAEQGLLLRARARREAPAVATAEYAMQALTLARLAASVAHEVKNPLNAMALQIALLGDKVATESEALAAACEGNLASMRTQIGRINEVVRRYLDVCDPPAGGSFDAGSLMTDAANLFGHEARRRRLVLTCEAAPGVVRVSGDPARAARLLLGILWRAVTSTPEGGRLVARVVTRGGEAALLLEHPQGPLDPALAWMAPVIAAAVREMGGRLDESADGEVGRVALVLPKERSV
jgi:signal transduction histidine kinase